MVETLSTPTWRSIGKLDKKVRLPLVWFSPHAKIMVLPDDETKLPSFVGELQRAGHYNLPTVWRPGMYRMTVHGTKMS